MKVLVTGAGGMVGSHMIEELFKKGHNVIGTYYKPTVNLKELNPAIPMVECDVRYPQAVEKIIGEFQPDQIYHLAAQSYPTVSWDHPYETIDINVCGTISIFEGVKKNRRWNSNYDPVVVVACSSAEYGATLEELTDSKVKESAELKPLHPYGVSKVGQDLLAFQYFKNDHIKCIRARIFNTTGTRKTNDVTSDLIMRAVALEQLENDRISLDVGNIETRRAIMDVRDLIQALFLLAEKGVYGDVYNISSEHIYQVKEIIPMIETQLGIKFMLNIDQTLLRPTDEKIIVGDVTKLKQDTGWKQQIPFESTVTEMIDYYRKKIKIHH